MTKIAAVIAPPTSRHCEERSDEAVQNRYKFNMKQPAVYIMANKRNGTLYTGVTSNLPKRVYEHRNNVVKGFTSKHNCKLLVFYSVFDTMAAAITEEKRIKGGSRKKKLALIESMNPEWRDLYDKILR